MSATVIDWPHVTIVDTKAMEWEEMPGVPGLLRKVLDPNVMLVYVTPGSPLGDLPYRHYHRTVHEFTYRLWGELPHWEYRDAAQQHGTYSNGKAGYFMHRLPGSIHGLEPGPVSPTGGLMLYWSTGPGAWVGEPGYDEETVHVPYADGWTPNPELREEQPAQDGTGTVIDWPDLRKLDTRAMAWEERAGLNGYVCKTLVRDDAGIGMVDLNYAPPGFTLPDLPYRHYHATVHEFGFTLAGELPHWEYESADQQQGELVVLREGYFMHRRPGSIHGVEAGPLSKTGRLSLNWRTGVGTWIGEPGFETETVGVPFG